MILVEFVYKKARKKQKMEKSGLLQDSIKDTANNLNKSLLLILMELITFRQSCITNSLQVLPSELGSRSAGVQSESEQGIHNGQRRVEDVLVLGSQQDLRDLGNKNVKPIDLAE